MFPTANPRVLRTILRTSQNSPVFPTVISIY
nr:MAG TPA: CUE domain protein [Caudoviricetes sp.]